MSCIARQSPQLPPSLQAQLTSCFSTALKHSELLPKLIEPPKVYTDESGSYTTDVSVYQTLVLAMGNMKESAPAVRYCKEALQWSALADSLSALCVFAEGLPNALAIIAEAVSHRVATTHKMPAGAERDEEERMDEEEEEGDRDYDSGKSADCGMTRACALVHDLALKCNTLVRAMLCALGMSTSLESVSVSISQGAFSKCFRLSLYELLQSSDIIPSLAALIALSQSAGDLSSLCEWSTPLRDHMAADADTCTLLVVSTTAALLALDDGVGFLLLSANQSAVQLIWQYLSQEDSVMTCQSIAELHLASQSANSPNGLLSMHPSSVGWILYLSGHATVLADTVISAFATLESLSCSTEFDNSPSKRRSQGGDEKLVLQEQLRLFDAVDALNATTYSPAGCSVVITVVSQFCIEALIEVARVGTHSASGTASSIVSSAARLLFLCALSGDKRALDALSNTHISQKIIDLAGAVALSAPLSLSALEQSVSAAAQLKQSSKTVDPRHRTVKVDVPRGYTDDVKVLAADVMLLSLPSPPKAIVVATAAAAIEGTLAIITDVDVDSSTPTDAVSRRKAVIAHFVSLRKLVSLNGAADEEPVELTHGSHWSCLPALSLAVNSLHASMTSSLHLSSALDSNEGETSSTSDIAHDGGLQHDLTVACEILNSMLQASEISAIRFGATCPVTLDTLVLADVVNCSLSGSMIFTKDDYHSNRMVSPPVSDGTADLSSAVESAVCKLSDVIRDADMCLHALEAVLGLLLGILRAAVAGCGVRFKHGSDTVASDYILNAVMDSRSAALAVVGEDKAGSLGSSVRAICALSASIFSLHCPKLIDLDPIQEISEIVTVDGTTSGESKSTPVSGLIARVAQRAIYVPSTLLSNLSLLIELLPAAYSCCHDVDDSVSVYNTANTLNMDVTSTGSKQDKKRQRDTREKQIERSVALFELWEAFCLHRYADSAATEEDIEKKKEEDLFRGSGSMVLPDDPLVSDLNPAMGHVYGRIGLRSLILYALASSSREVHRLASVLCVKSMCLGAVSAVDVSSAIVHTIQRRVALHLAFSGEADEPQTFAPELSLCRLLLLVESLCRTDTLCVALVQEGLLLPALQSVRSGTDRNVCILAMQLLTTIHRTLLRITSAQAPLDDAGNASKDSLSIKRKLLWVTHALTDALVGALPLALVSFQDSPQGVLLWQQAVLTMSLLPSSCIKKLLETISATLTLEGLAVKLWQAFEDSYQQLFEVTELIKLCQAHPEEASLQDLAGQDCGQGVLRSAHILYTGAACALRAVIDIALMSFLEGTIALPTLARACRTSLSDPKKVVLRYQRAYTMWAVQARQSASNSNSNSSGIGSDGGKSARRCTAFTPFASGPISDPQCSDSFDSRHELISAALRSAVESTGRVSRLVAGREIRPKGGNGIIKSTDMEAASAISIDFDFYRPFCELGEAEGDMLRLWFACTPPCIRLAGLSDLHTGRGEDTLHTVLRRGLLDGDDTEASIYNSSVFVHLGASKVALTNRGKRKWVQAAIESNEKHQIPEAPRPLPLMPIFNPSLSLLRSPVPVPGLAPHTRQFLSTQGPPPPPPPLFMPPNQNQQQHRQQLMGRTQAPQDFSVPHQTSLPPPPLPPRMQMRPDTQFPPPPNLQQQQQQQQQVPNPNQNQRW